MNIFYVELQYQGDDRVTDSYLAYADTDDEDLVENRIIMSPDFGSYEMECISNWAEEDDDDDEKYASVVVSLISQEDYNENKNYYDRLEIIYDERID